MMSHRARNDGARPVADPEAPDIRDRVTEALSASRLAPRTEAPIPPSSRELALDAQAPERDPQGRCKGDLCGQGHDRGAGPAPGRREPLAQGHAALCADDAPVVAALLEAGAVLIGLTALHELAFGVTGINAVHRDARPIRRLEPG